MIKIINNSLPVRDCNGTVQLINFDQLEEDLEQACIDAGCFDLDFLQDLVSVIYQYVHGSRDSNAPCDTSDVEHMIVRLLSNTGFDRVSDEFCRRRQLEYRGHDGRIVDADPDSVRQLIKNDPCFNGKSVDRITDQVLDRLRSLNFSKSTDDLVIALAKTIAMNNPPCDDRMDRKAVEKYDHWLIHENILLTLLPITVCRLVRTGIIAIGSVSTLFPRVYIRINLAELTNEQICPVELMLYPELDGLCIHLNRIISVVRDEIFARADSSPTTDLPTILVLHWDTSRGAEAGITTISSNLQADIKSLMSRNIDGATVVRFTIGSER